MEEEAPQPVDCESRERLTSRTPLLEPTRYDTEIMHGLFGIIASESSRRELKNRIGQMSGVIGAHPDDDTGLFVGDGAAMRAVDGTTGRGVSSLYEDNDVAVAFWGYLWNRDELSGLTRRGGQADGTPPSEILARLWRRLGADTLDRFNGRFVAAMWHKKKKEMTLVNDRFGFCPLYYRTAPGWCGFGSQYKAFLADRGFRRDVDVSALGDFLSLGYSTGERTLFKQVRLLPPASVATLRPGGGPSIRRYWDYSFHSDADPVQTEPQYEEGFFSHLETALKRQTAGSGRVLVPVSGGYDSRILSGMLSRAKGRDGVVALSYGHDHALDVVYGRKIARKCGLKHYNVPIAPDYLSRFAERFVWMLEGTVNCLNAHMLTTFDVIESEDIDSVMTGFFGDIVAGSGTWIYSLGVLEGRPDEEVFERQYGVHCDIMNAEDIVRYVRPEYQEETKSSARKALWSRYRNCKTKNQYFRSRYYSMHERQRRYTNFNLYVFDHKNVIAPFVDNEFVDYILHIPANLLINQKLYSNVMVKYMPELARIPYNETRLPINASWCRKGLQWRWEKWNRNPLIQATVGRKWKKMNDNYIRSAEAIRSGSREYVVDHIKGCPLIEEFFVRCEVDRMIDSHLSGTSHNQMKILSLLTLSLWNRLFRQPS